MILGCANQAGEDNRNVARMAVLLAGFPVEVAGLTVNRLCGSGLQAVNSAAQAIAVGDGEVFIAGGVESMSRAPYVMLKPEAALERGTHELVDSTLGWRFVNPKLDARYPTISLGETAECVADDWSISRERQDAFALESQRARLPRSRPAGSTASWSRCRSRSGRATRSSSPATSTRAPTRRRRRWPGCGRPSARPSRGRRDRGQPFDGQLSR